MSLINGMSGDTNGGVCLKYHLDYYTYTNVPIGCSCNDVIGHIIEDIFIGSYLLPYVNVNPNYNPTGETLELGVVSIDDWVDGYINSLVTGGTIENRIIHDQISNKFYYIEERDDESCSGDTISRWAIIDYATEVLWTTGANSYFYSEVDNCGNEIGKRQIKLKDINPMSSTFGDVIIIDKCENETEPLIINHSPFNITSNSAYFTASISNNGGYPILRKGFVYARHRNPTLYDDIILVSDNLMSYTGQTTNLSPEKYYYVKAFAENIIGTSYSESYSFVTN